MDREIEELVSTPIRSDLKCLITISGHKVLKADLVIFKVILRKHFNRLHTSQISRRFNVINSRINQFVKMDISNSFSKKLETLIKEKYDTRTGKVEYPSYEQVAWIMEFSIRACEIMHKIIRDIISVFEDCTLWIKLGHFARQMRIMTAAVSRLSVFFKTIVIKICDIYPYLYAYLELADYSRLEEDQPSKEIFHYLTMINVEPPKIQEVKSSSKVKFKSMYENSKRGDAGQKISRNLFNEKIKQKTNDGDLVNGNCVSESVGKAVQLDTSKRSICQTTTKTPSPQVNGHLRADISDESLDFKDELLDFRDQSLNSNSKSKNSTSNNKSSRSSSLKFNLFVGTTLRNKEEDAFFDLNNNDGSFESIMNAVDDREDAHSDLIDDDEVPNRLNGHNEEEMDHLNNHKLTNGMHKSSASENKQRSKKAKNRAEIRLLIKEFKLLQKIKKAKRRKEIRKSMQFEVE